MFRYLVLSAMILSGCHTSGGDSGSARESRTPPVPEPDSGLCEEIKVFADEGGTVCQVKNSAHKVEIRINPPGLPDTGLAERFNQASGSQRLKLVRKIHKIADKFQLNKWGFYLNGGSEGRFFVMHSDYLASDSKNASIKLDSQSLPEPASEYKPYVEQGDQYQGDDQPERDVAESPMSVSFWSLSGRSRLIIPKKNYLTIYHFSRDASDTEVHDLCEHIEHELKKTGANKYRNLAVHTGSVHAQTVKHFHFRLEK